MTALARRGSIVAIKENAAIGAEIAGVGGFMWLVFRVLVGAVMADSIASIKTIEKRLETLEESNRVIMEKLLEK